MRPSSVMRIDSAGIQFGSVLGTREVGRFLLRESRYPPELVVPRHDHEAPYFSLVVSGAIHERDPRGRWSYPSGSLHFHPGADPHSGHTNAAGLVCLSVVPRGRLALVLDARLSARGAEPPILAALAMRCHREFRARDTASDLALEASCLELAAASLRAGIVAPGPGIPRWLAAACDLLHASLDRRVTISELAHVAQVHPAHLARVFRRHFGSSPGGYVRRLRIERARLALATTDEPIAAIALAAGFASQAHFTHVFRRMVGIPPGTYRRQLRGDPERAKSASAARNVKDSDGTSL